MSDSTLDPDNAPLGNDRSLGRGHGTGALGPSDSSDSGSDVRGGPGLGMETGERGTAGADLGDPNLESDSDSNGTGERAGIGRDTIAPDGADIDVDHIETIPLGEVDLDEDDGRGPSQGQRA
ncbi:hypothetical protein HSX11_26915 [Oxalobacteraceae bacterium]|nr:hypothetical protein [Oxalobacteraceae bacterium]